MAEEAEVKISKKVKKKFPYRPLFDDMILTAKRKTFTASGIYLAEDVHGKGALNTSQEVLRVGENVPKYIKVGSMVELKVASFPKERHPAPNDVGPDTYTAIPPLYEMEDKTEFLIVNPRNLLYVIEG